MAARNNFWAVFDVLGVRSHYRRAPFAFAFAFFMTLLLAVPLYLLKIEIVPRELGWLPSLFRRAGAAALTDRRGECVYAGCPHYRRCFIERAERASREADIVIANHALVMVNAAREREDAPGRVPEPGAGQGDRWPRYLRPGVAHALCQPLPGRATPLARGRGPHADHEQRDERDHVAADVRAQDAVV